MKNFLFNSRGSARYLLRICFFGSFILLVSFSKAQSFNWTTNQGWSISSINGGTNNYISNETNQDIYGQQLTASLPVGAGSTYLLLDFELFMQHCDYSATGCDNLNDYLGIYFNGVQYFTIQSLHTGTYGGAITALNGGVVINTPSNIDNPIVGSFNDMGHTILEIPITAGLAAGTYPLSFEYIGYDDWALSFNGVGVSVSLSTYLASVCSGNNSSTSITSTPAGINAINYSYQWQVSVDGGYTWNYLVDGINYSGSNSPTLNLSNITSLSNGYKYSCVVTASGVNNSAATGVSPPFTLNVNPNNTAGSASSNPTSCINTPLPDITITTSGATGIGVPTGLPAGVTASWSSNLITISGTPTVSGVFNYSIPLTGGCANINATGTITVNANNTAGSASSNPTLCINTVLTNITIATTGATGIGTPTGLPAGVTASWSSNVITISGTPTASGVFTYAIPLTGGCANINATGTITVKANNTVGVASSNPTLCINTVLTNITIATTGATGIGTPTGLPAGVTASWSSNVITISGTPTASGVFTYTIPLTGGCANVNATGTITVKANNTVGVASSNPTLCINTALTNITIATTGATGIGTATGLPAGVTASWSSSLMTISGTPTASGIFTYNIPLTGGCSNVSAVGSIAVNPTLPASVSITSSATNNTICVGTSVTFAATPTNGGTNPTYQWKKAGVNIPNATTATYTTTTLANGDIISVVMTSNASPCLTGSPTTSNSITTTVNALPAITSQPTNASVCVGAATSFSVNATGLGLTYQWQVSKDQGNTWIALSDGIVYSGSTTATLSLSSSTSLSYNLYMYQCVVSGTCTPSTFSNAVTLTVNAIPTITGFIAGATCGTGAVLLGATASAGTINWYATATGGPSLGTGPSYTTPSIIITTRYFVDATALGCTTASRTAIFATINPIPSISSVAAASNCGPGTVALGAASLAGTINWYSAATGGSSLGTGANYTTPSISSTTTYYVDATASGCTTLSRTAVTATINALPIISVQPSTSVQNKLCLAGVGSGASALNITAIAGSGTISSYQWYSNTTAMNTTGTIITGATSASYTPTIAGSLYYYAVVTNSNGCSLTSNTSGAIVLYPLPTASFNTVLPECLSNNSFSFISSTVLSSGTINNLSWNFGDGTVSSGSTLNHSYLIAGTYNVKLVATSNYGCQDSMTKQVIVYPKPTALFTLPAAQCLINNSFSFTSSSVLSSGIINNLSWSFGDGSTSNASPIMHSYGAGGNYNVQLLVTSDNGCTDSVTKSVTVFSNPIASVTSSGSLSFCSGDSILLSSSSIAGSGTIIGYQWYNNGVVLPGASKNNLTAYQSGNYELQVTNSNGCVVNTAVVPLTVNPLPIGALIAPVGSNGVICAGTNVLLSSTGGASYQWFLNNVAIAGATGFSYTTANPGNYTVQLISAQGCKNFATGNASLSMNKKPNLLFSYDAFCVSKPIDFINQSDISQSGPVSILWDFGDNSQSTLSSPVHVYSLGKPYKVSLTITPTNCPNLDSTLSGFIQIETPPVAIRYPNAEVLSNTNITLQARNIGNQYVWYPSTGLSSSLVIDPVFNSIVPINYLIQISDSAGCTITDTLSVLTFKESAIFVPKAFTPNGDGHNDKLEVFLAGMQQLNYFKVFDRWGKLVFQTSNAGEFWDGNYNGTKQPTETYVWIAQGITTAGETINRKGQTILIR